MGAHSCLGEGAICYAMAKVTLEPYALVSQRAHLCGGTHDVDNADFKLLAKPSALSKMPGLRQRLLSDPA